MGALALRYATLHLKKKINLDLASPGCRLLFSTASSAIPPSLRRFHSSTIATASKSSSAANPSIAEELVTPRIPLCERAPAHITPLTSLLNWKDGAAARATAAGTSWTGEQDAPSVEDLHTELSWLLDDAVAGLRSSPTEPWQPKTWQYVERQLEKDYKSAQHRSSIEIHLRESLENLDEIWRQRIENRVPLQYLTSCAFWRDLVLSVGPGVLIPRPETELLIDFALEGVSEHSELHKGPWADLGTGSGALAIGLACALPKTSKVYAVDLAAEPAAHAAFNAERAGVGGRVQILRGSWYDPLRAAGVSQLAGILSNPPYITNNLLDGLQAEVGLYEPALALGGGDGLGIDALAPICIGAVEMLQSGGFIGLETAGGEQAEYIAQLLQHLRCASSEDDGEKEKLAFEHVKIRKDLRGVDRFVTAIRTDHS